MNFHGVAYKYPQIWVAVKEPDTNLYYSPNNGERWVTLGIETGGSFLPLWDVEFIDSLKGFAVGSAGVVYSTEDGGQTWNLVSYGATKFFTRVRFLDDRVGWLSGGDNIYGKTSDGGHTWEWYLTSTEVHTDLYGVSSLDENTAWEAGGVPVTPGGQGYLFLTINGGEEWEIIDSSQVYDFLDVVFFNLLNGIVVGGMDTFPYLPVVRRTTDGGITWENTTPPFGKTLRALSFVDSLHGWAVGMEGTIIRTKDGGFSWENLSYPTHVTFFDVEFVDSLRGVVVGDSGFVLITDDGGESWRIAGPVISVKESYPAEIPQADRRANVFVDRIRLDGANVQLVDRSGRIIRKAERNGVYFLFMERKYRKILFLR